MDLYGTVPHFCRRRVDRHHSSCETEHQSLLQAEFRKQSGTDLAAESHFTKDYGGPHKGFVEQARKNRSDDGEVRGGLIHFEPSDYIQINILVPEIDAEAFLEHRRQQCQPLGINTGGEPPGCSEMSS